MSQPNDHFVFVPLTAWSHLRLILTFSLNLLVLHPSLVNTILITSLTRPRLDREVALQPDGLKQQVEGRWRVLVVEDGLEDGVTPAEERKAFGENFPNALRDLLIETEGRFATVPCAFLCDVRREVVIKADGGSAVPHVRPRRLESGHGRAGPPEDPLHHVLSYHGRRRRSVRCSPCQPASRNTP